MVMVGRIQLDRYLDEERHLERISEFKKELSRRQQTNPTSQQGSQSRKGNPSDRGRAASQSRLSSSGRQSVAQKWKKIATRAKSVQPAQKGAASRRGGKLPHSHRGKAAKSNAFENARPHLVLPKKKTEEAYTPPLVPHLSHSVPRPAPIEGEDEVPEHSDLRDPKSSDEKFFDRMMKSATAPNKHMPKQPLGKSSDKKLTKTDGAQKLVKNTGTKLTGTGMAKRPGKKTSKESHKANMTERVDPKHGKKPAREDLPGKPVSAAVGQPVGADSGSQDTLAARESNSPGVDGQPERPQTPEADAAAPIEPLPLVPPDVSPVAKQLMDKVVAEIAMTASGITDAELEEEKQESTAEKDGGTEENVPDNPEEEKPAEESQTSMASMLTRLRLKAAARMLLQKFCR